jgi:hypothetical protein
MRRVVFFRKKPFRLSPVVIREGKPTPPVKKLTLAAWPGTDSTGREARI